MDMSAESLKELAERAQMDTIARDELFGAGNVACYAAALINMARSSVEPTAEVEAIDVELLCRAHELQEALDARVKTVANLGRFIIPKPPETEN